MFNRMKEGIRHGLPDYTKYQINQVAEICLVNRKPVKDAVQVMGLIQPNVSEIKNNSVTYLAALDILCRKKGYKPLLQRITKDQMKEAVRLFIKESMTLPEIDNELKIKPGTCRLYSKTPIWKLECYRQKRWGDDEEV